MYRAGGFCALGSRDLFPSLCVNLDATKRLEWCTWAAVIHQEHSGRRNLQMRAPLLTPLRSAGLGVDDDGPRTCGFSPAVQTGGFFWVALCITLRKSLWQRSSRNTLKVDRWPRRDGNSNPRRLGISMPQQRCFLSHSWQVCTREPRLPVRTYLPGRVYEQSLSESDSSWIRPAPAASATGFSTLITPVSRSLQREKEIP